MNAWVLGGLVWLAAGFIASWVWGSLARFSEEPAEPPADHAATTDDAAGEPPESAAGI